MNVRPIFFFPFLFTRNLVKVTQTKADKSRHASVFHLCSLAFKLAFLTLFFFIVFQAQLRTNNLWPQQEIVKEAFSDKIGLDHIAKKKMTSTGSTAGSGGPKGQLISKCPFDVIIPTNIPTKFLQDFCPSL